MGVYDEYQTLGEGVSSYDAALDPFANAVNLPQLNMDSPIYGANNPSPNWGGTTVGINWGGSGGAVTPTGNQTAIPASSPGSSYKAKATAAGGGGSGLGVNNMPSGATDYSKFNSKLAIPEFAAQPTLTMPTYAAPAYDESKVKKYTQQYANPYMADIRRTVMNAIATSRGSSNPVVAKFIQEGAMGGMGSKTGEVMAAAGKYGQAAYNDEYGREADVAKTNYAANVQGVLGNFEAAKSAINTENQARWNTSMATYTTNVDLYKTALTSFLKSYEG
jgi:hypothetical protein